MIAKSIGDLEGFQRNLETLTCVEVLGAWKV